MISGKLPQFRFAAARRVAVTTAGFALMCAWPLLLFKLRIFGG